MTVSSLATLLTALAMILGLGGGGIRWAVIRADKAIDEVKGELKETRLGHDECHRELEKIRAHQKRDGYYLYLAIGELERIDPRNIVLAQLRGWLMMAYPLDPHIPDEIRALLARLHEIPGVPQPYVEQSQDLQGDDDV